MKSLEKIDLESLPAEEEPESALPQSMDDPALSWTKDDIEQRLGFRGGRFTSAGRALSLILAIFLTLLFYILTIYVLQPNPVGARFASMFIEHGIVPYPVVLLFFWSLSILFIKARKLAYQRRALDLAAVPQESNFVLNPRTARAVLERIHGLVDHTKHFVLLNRIERALSNLQNIGRIGDVSEILRTQGEYDEEQQHSSYSLLGGFIWAIPVIGFIGTVLGLSEAIGSFGATMDAGGDAETLKDSLKGVTGGLSTAFETTLIALVAALVVQIRVTFLQARESNFLDECNEYCHAHVVSKLRLTDDLEQNGTAIDEG